MKENRGIFVAFSEQTLKDSFDKLSGGTNEEKELHAFINRAFDDLKKDPFVGIKIPKKLWPKEYGKNYGINNLWKYDLPNACGSYIQ